MKSLLEFIVKKLADHPDQVKVEETDQNGTVQLQLTVAEQDKGKIIGKQGKVIKAIRSVVSVAAAKTGKRSSIDVD